MQRSTAMKKLNQLLGKGAGYRIDDKAPTQADRDAAKAELPAAVKERDKLRAELEARREAVLLADPEYQALKEALSAARKRADHLSGTTYRHKITVGKTIMDGLMFSVMAEADTWEEIFEKLTKKKAA